jgi:hypothetical protein
LKGCVHILLFLYIVISSFRHHCYLFSALRTLYNQHACNFKIIIGVFDKSKPYMFNADSTSRAVKESYMGFIKVDNVAICHADNVEMEIS